MNTLKKPLVAELTAALGPVLHAQPGAAEVLPKPVEKAIEQLAEAALARPARSRDRYSL